MSRSDPNAPKKLAILNSRGTLDYAYPPLILASTAGAMGWDVLLFFTFYGLPLLLKDINPEATPLGNPAMPMKMPFGPEGFQAIDWKLPAAMMAIPGFTALTTTLMKQSFKNKGIATIPELRGYCIDTDVKLVACQMTMEAFGFTMDQFIPEASYGGAATFLDYAADADVQLFI
jgi:peroxiredoxin family protein